MPSRLADADAARSASLYVCTLIQALQTELSSRSNANRYVRIGILVVTIKCIVVTIKKICLGSFKPGARAEDPGEHCCAQHDHTFYITEHCSHRQLKDSYRLSAQFEMRTYARIIASATNCSRLS